MAIILIVNNNVRIQLLYAENGSLSRIENFIVGMGSAMDTNMV